MYFTGNYILATKLKSTLFLLLNRARTHRKKKNQLYSLHLNHKDVLNYTNIQTSRAPNMSTKHTTCSFCTSRRAGGSVSGGRGSARAHCAVSGVV